MTLLPAVVGAPVGGAGSSLVIPITASVPRSDPGLGATVILIYYQLFGGGISITGATDSAIPEDDYSLCIFEDGLNHYSSTITNPLAGLIVNDLEDGVDSITVTLSGAADWFQAAAIALTGLDYFVSGAPPVISDPTLPGFLGSVLQSAEAPVGGGTGTSLGINFDIDSGGSITIPTPTGASDEDWDWATGDLALYTVVGSQEADHGGWTWASPDISDFLQWDVATGSPEGQAQMAIGLQSVTPGDAAPTLGGVWGDASLGIAGGGGLAFVGGMGPECTSPPAGGNPVFNNHIRLSD